MTTLRLERWGLRAFGRVLPCAIGRGGVRRDKREGDMATPVGHLRLTAMLYRPDRVAKPAPWARPILPGDLWCDAPDDPRYNSAVRAPCAASHEAMRRADPLYDLVLVTDWNAVGVAGAGSAIFLHQWRRPRYPTAGCVALAREDLLFLAQRLEPDAVLVVPAHLDGWGARGRGPAGAGGD